MTASAVQPNFLAIDFYCGAGGTARGLIDAGGYVIAGIDKSATCERTYRSNNRNATLDGELPAFIAKDMFPRTPDYPEGEQHEILTELRNLVPRYREQAPGSPLMFAVCAPCQSFTKFVQTHITEDRRTGRVRDLALLSQALGFVDEFRPELVLSENVAGIRRGRHRDVWYDFQQELRGMGYAVGEDEFCASAFGIPQRRRRSIMVAARSWNGADEHLEHPLAGVESEGPLSVREAIGHLPPLRAGERMDEIPNHVCRNLTEVNRQRLMSVEPGEPNFGFGELALPCHTRLGDGDKRGFGDTYTRMHPDRPSPTITTRFHSVSNGRFGHYEKRQVRGLSLREGAILQSFPEGYEFFANGMEPVARMIGNAVPPKLAEHAARWLFETWSANGGVAAARSLA